MGRLFIEDTTLSAIGDAIREKTGSSELMSPLDMPTAIGSIETGGGGGEATITSWDITQQLASSNFSSPTANNVFNEYIDGKSFTLNISGQCGVAYLFANSNLLVDLSKVVINYSSSGVQNGLAIMFDSCGWLEYFPTLRIADSCNRNGTNFHYMFRECFKLRYIDEDFWQSALSLFDNSTDLGNTRGIFTSCNSLRELPDLTFFNDKSTNSSYSNVIYNEGFKDCYCLDAVYIPIINTTTSITRNMFVSTVNNCCRAKDVIFATDNGTPYVRTWSSQTIDLTNYVGFAYNIGYITSEQRNAGITTDKYVNSDATYQALKNDPDWFSDKVEYSRYNHDSAVATINSLPDCSAGSGNTIKFLGASGSATDGGAISNLTEEEIAVATAKGWTVSIV